MRSPAQPDRHTVGAELAVRIPTEARAQRVDVTAETCPHYLLLNDKDVIRLGATAKCTPPIRDEKRRVALWQELRAGNIQTVGSDHSPAPPEMRRVPSMSKRRSFFSKGGRMGGGSGGRQGWAGARF